MNLSLAPITIGWVIAFIVFVLCVVLIVVGQLPLVAGILIAGAALARMF